MYRKKKCEASRSDWKFCSRSCCTIYKNKERILKPDYVFGCVCCGKQMHKTNKHKGRSSTNSSGLKIYATNSRFCSKQCTTLYINKYENPAKTVIARTKISEFCKKRGTKHLNTVGAHEKQRLSISGKNHWNWQGGKTSSIRKLRNSLEIKAWRKSVFERDDYTCQLCGIRGTYLEADHIKPFATYPELRLDVDNGRTLCRPCHKTTDTFGGRTKLTK